MKQTTFDSAINRMLTHYWRSSTYIYNVYMDYLEESKSIKDEKKRSEFFENKLIELEYHLENKRLTKSYR